MLAHILLLVLAAMSTLAAPTRRDRLQPLPKRLLRRSGSTVPRSEVQVRKAVPLGPEPGVYEPGYDTEASSDSAVHQTPVDSSSSDGYSHSSAEQSSVNRLLAALGITDTRVESSEWEDFAAVLEAALTPTSEDAREAQAAPDEAYGQAGESVPAAKEGLAWRIALSQARKKLAGLVVQDVLR